MGPNSHLCERLRVVDVVAEGANFQLRDRVRIANRPAALAGVQPSVTSVATMFWDEEFELPDPALVQRLLEGPCHVWHAGLTLGQAGQPKAWDICQGRAMLNADAKADIASTSWRLTSRAAIVRNEVFDRFGGFDASFDTPAGAALDAGLRWITHGAIARQVPTLLAGTSGAPPDDPPTAGDGLRIVRRQLGISWAVWAAYRGLRTGTMPASELVAALRTMREPLPPKPAAYGLPAPLARSGADARVTVLVPTVGRYPYVEKLLTQLAEQTRPPDEVVVVDQNPEAERRDLTAVAPGLPVQVFHLLPPGQCTARNLGLQASTGSYILFLDDDDEIPTDLIEQHLAVLACPEIAVSCGLVDDAETGPAPASLRFRKAGSTFPTNNAMIRRAVLHQTGLFDPTYDRGSRADHDLGMRSYLAGNLHVYDPRPQVFHHHAPMGGLRTHGARIRTRGNSRSTIIHRHLRTPTDIYLGLRYYTAEQVDEDLVRSAFSTLRGGGSPLRQTARLVAQLALLPNTLAQNRNARRQGELLLQHRPEIPHLTPEDAEPDPLPVTARD